MSRSLIVEYVVECRLSIVDWLSILIQQSPINNESLIKDHSSTIDSVLPHVVIIGGGFGGLSAAGTLRNADVRVTLIDRRNHHVFQPLLYQVATATLSPGDIAAPIRWILRRVATSGSSLRTRSGSTSRGSSRRAADGAATLDYDWLIVATGSSHLYFGHADWEPNAPGLKTLEDAIAIRRRILIAFERAEREEDTRRQR